jgi:tetratricopeptide (TPR) repeat protein
MKTKQPLSTPFRILLLAFGVIALTILVGRSTINNNYWSIRFVQSVWGTASAPPQPPVSHPNAKRWLAEEAGEAGQVIEAANRLSLLAADGDRFSRRSLGHMLAARDDLSEAYALWKMDGDFNSVETWATRAEAAANLDDAYEGLRIAYQIDPQRGARSLAGFLVSQQATDEAIAVLNDVLDTQAADPRRAAWLLQLARLYEERGDWTAAETMYKELQALPGRQLSAYVGLANLAYESTGTYEAAAPHLAAARAAAPYESEAFYETGRLLGKDERYEDADQWFREAVEREPEALRNWLAYADNATRAGAPAVAISRYQNALTRFPDSDDLYFRLASIHILIEDWASAKAANDEIIRLNAASTPARLLQTAEIAEALNDDAAAKNAYQALLTTDPGNRMATEGLRRLGAPD